MPTNILLTRKPDTQAMLVMTLEETLVITDPVPGMTSWPYLKQVQDQLTHVGFTLAWKFGMTRGLVLDNIMCSENAFEFEFEAGADPVDVVTDLLAHVSEVVDEISATYRFVWGVDPKPLRLDDKDVQADLRAFAR